MALCAVLALLLGALPTAARAESDSDTRASLLAVGDTGTKRRRPAHLDGQRRVGAALAAAHRAAPANALVFLGDNFYYQGLARGEVAERIARNLVRPYCPFFALSGPLSSAVRGACPTPLGRRRPIPVYAVLGNHDLGHAESPLLQREEIPRYLPNWRMTAGVAEAVEIAPGMSLILGEYVRLVAQQDPEPLARALRAARGPFRVLVLHQPIATTPASLGSKPPSQTRYARLVSAALRRAGVRVQLVLSGDEHNLQILEMAPPFPPLHAVAGGGWNRREIDSHAEARRFAMASTGFARVDLQQGPTGARLVVSLTAVPVGLLGSWRPPEVVSRWSVDANGTVRNETEPPEAAGR